MSYYKKPERAAYLAPANAEKEAFKALSAAELKSKSLNQNVSVSVSSKRSSATLLRSKLSGSLVRNFQKI